VWIFAPCGGPDLSAIYLNRSLDGLSFQLSGLIHRLPARRCLRAPSRCHVFPCCQVILIRRATGPLLDCGSSAADKREYVSDAGSAQAQSVIYFRGAQTMTPYASIRGRSPPVLARCLVRRTSVYSRYSLCKLFIVYANIAKLDRHPPPDRGKESVNERGSPKTRFPTHRVNLNRLIPSHS
jgi:hypothetical protein